jgi:hypothetical protein
VGAESVVLICLGGNKKPDRAKDVMAPAKINSAKTAIPLYRLLRKIRDTQVNIRLIFVGLPIRLILKSAIQTPLSYAYGLPVNSHNSADMPTLGRLAIVGFPFYYTVFLFCAKDMP